MVVGLHVENDYDEADCAMLDSSLAGYIERAIDDGGLTPAEAREVERLGAEVRERLASLTLQTGQTQMRLLAALAEAAFATAGRCRYLPAAPEKGRCRCSSPPDCAIARHYRRNVASLAGYSLVVFLHFVGPALLMVWPGA